MNVHKMTWQELLEQHKAGMPEATHELYNRGWTKREVETDGKEL